VFHDSQTIIADHNINLSIFYCSGRMVNESATSSRENSISRQGERDGPSGSLTNTPVMREGRPLVSGPLPGPAGTPLATPLSRSPVNEERPEVNAQAMPHVQQYRPQNGSVMPSRHAYFCVSGLSSNGHDAADNAPRFSWVWRPADDAEDGCATESGKSKLWCGKGFWRMR
jgi:hypothetical protein